MINKFKFMLLFVATIGMVSCSDDDGGGQTTSGDIVGTWEMSAFSFETSSTEEVGGETITTNYSGVGTEIEDVQVTFHGDGDLTTNGNTFNVELTMEIMGQTTTEMLSAITIVNPGTWEKNGNTVVFTDLDGNTGEFTIQTLNNTTLHLTGVLETSFTGAVTDMNVDIQFTNMGSPTTGGGDPSGTWEPTALTYNGTTTVTSGGQTITTNYDAVATDFGNTTITFKNDGTFDSSGNGITVDMTMTYMGQTITQEMTAPGFINEGTWSVNGDTMTITNDGGEPGNVEIVELNATTLRLKGEMITSMSGADVELNYDMTLTKQ